jgi:hypothetical protein
MISNRREIVALVRWMSYVCSGREMGATSKARRDNRMRYFVVNGKAQSAFEMLKKSLDRTPVPTGDEVKYLKLPSATIVNKILHSVAQQYSQDDRILRDACRMIPVLTLQNIDIFPRTILAYYHQGNAKSEQFLKQYLDSKTVCEVADVLSAMLESQVAAKSREGILHALNLMQTHNVMPSGQDALVLLRYYVYGDEQRWARAILPIFWFNGMYVNEQTNRIEFIQGMERYGFLSLGSSVLTRAASNMISDLRHVYQGSAALPDAFAATAAGLCAIERNSGGYLELKKEYSLVDNHCGKLLTMSLLHLYVRSQCFNELLALIIDAANQRALPLTTILQPIVMYPDQNAVFVASIIEELKRLNAVPREDISLLERCQNESIPLHH